MASEEQIRKAVDGLDEDTAKDALALLLAGKGADARRSGISTSRAADAAHGGDLANFAQAIGWLKSRYDFQELEAFTTEADLVYVKAGDRRILLTDRNAPTVSVTEARPDARRFPAYQEGSFESAWEPVVSARQAEPLNTSGQPAPVEEATPLPEQTKDGMDDAFEPLPKNGRFSNLEL